MPAIRILPTLCSVLVLSACLSDTAKTPAADPPAQALPPAPDGQAFSSAEYDAWRRHHGLSEADFGTFEPAGEASLQWGPWNTDSTTAALHRSLFIWRHDSAYWIDLHSYSCILERKAGTLISLGCEPDTKIQWVRRSDSAAVALLYCGTVCMFETACWTDSATVELLGVTETAEATYIPTRWRIDLQRGRTWIAYAARSFTTRPDSYFELRLMQAGSQ
ncbi:MAG: hypothetical protein NW241_10590 [Bacteroidia bacterium]|nr:hypothetical protein [Bacteroidia bacterium]